ncbi:hypothetical protein FQS87_15725 [Enterococcus avium]|jgi:hypothetical protein|uniref:hypothetical protein n=1 Tax=Enterococcus TaxID=1350 RepID=UPI001A977FED|nr:hypothetical protein [Enterococcus avium]MBO1141356.1 hypothetical protein [Enterococcus avium]
MTQIMLIVSITILSVIGALLLVFVIIRHDIKTEDVYHIHWKTAKVCGVNLNYHKGQIRLKSSNINLAKQAGANRPKKYIKRKIGSLILSLWLKVSMRG